MTIERFRGSGRSPALDRHALLALAAILLFLLLAPALARAQADSLTLTWTAPGDDGSLGAAASYEIRMSTSAITAGNYSSATVLANGPVPQPAGAAQSLIVRGLSRSTDYWFVVRSRDDVGNWSPLSNIVRWTWPVDNAPPAAPTALVATVEGGKSVRLGWAASASANVAGYVVYRADLSTGPWERLNVQPVTAPEYVDDRLPVDVAKVWYQVSAVNSAGVESARSAVAMAPVLANLSRDPVAWKLRSVYPNPSHSFETVHLPIDVPTVTADAHVEIHDAADQRVRVLPVRSSVTGVVEVDWDGNNDRAQRCAPGVYRAWLIAPGVRQALAIARLP